MQNQWQFKSLLLRHSPSVRMGFFFCFFRTICNADETVDLTKLQGTEKRVADLAAEIAPSLSVDIVLYRDSDTSAMGFYDYENDAIYLNVASKVDMTTLEGKQTAMAFTLGHELLHRAKVGSPKGYDAFTKFLLSEYGKAGMDLEQMIGEQIALSNAHDKTLPADKRVNMTRDMAIEEIAAEACSRMLVDTDAGKKLAVWGQESKTNADFVTKVKKMLQKLVNRLRAALKGADPGSETIHGNEDSVQRLINALNEDSNNNAAVFYINRNKATKFLRPAGNQISRAAKELDGFIHSVTEKGSHVKMRIDSVTESQQFKRWFGDWKNHPDKASKVVNEDGTPKIMYHGTNATFSVFDKRKAKLGVFGKGFYFAPTEGRAKAYGTGRVIETYLNIKNPYIVNDSMGFTYEDYKNIQKQFGISEEITDNNIVRILQKQDYDGIMAYDRNRNLLEVVAFNSNQIKSATDNIGTFDGSNPDIRYRLAAGPDLSARTLLSDPNL